MQKLYSRVVKNRIVFYTLGLGVRPNILTARHFLLEVPPWELSFISELKDEMNDMKKGVTLIPSSDHLKQSIFYPIVFVALSLFMFCFPVSENMIILLLPGSKTFCFPVI